jgi:hypothetical protein
MKPVIRFAATPIVWFNIVADGADVDELPNDDEFFARFRSWMASEKIHAANVPSSWGYGKHSTAFHRKDWRRVHEWLETQGCEFAKDLHV